MTKPKPKPKPLWRGPYPTDESAQHGITQSLLTRFITCRDRFHKKVVMGLQEAQTWDAVRKMEYGSIFHEGLDKYSGHIQKAQKKKTKPSLASVNKAAIKAMTDYTAMLKATYPSDLEDIDKWYTLACHQFERYARHWIKDDLKIHSILQEETFAVPYELPSGRTVLLRGKWDSAYRANGYLYLQENKTKGYINENQLSKVLFEDFQSMFYIIALSHYYPDDTVAGVLYNVIRRPLASKFSIRPKKDEKDDIYKFYSRVGEEIGNKPDHYFLRWNVDICKADITRFKKQVFHPILESLCDWWDSIKLRPFDPWHTYLKHRDLEGNRVVRKLSRKPNHLHYRRPFNLFDPNLLQMADSHFRLITTGSPIGLEKIQTLFPELDE